MSDLGTEQIRQPDCHPAVAALAQDMAGYCYGRPAHEASIMEHPLAQEVAANDGQTTYLVHSTVPETAEAICETGLRVEAIHLVYRTACMLAGPVDDDPAKQIALNKFYLDYRYKKGIFGACMAKVLLAFDCPRPTGILPDGTKSFPQDDPVFTSRYLQETGNERRMLFPAGRVQGYFDLKAGEFKHNPQFELDTSRAAPVALPHGSGTYASSTMRSKGNGVYMSGNL